MATYRTPHMNLTIPDNNTQGPGYAQQDISNGSLYFLGEHNHDGINTGQSINIAGQIIQNDLSLDGYNLTNARSLGSKNNLTTLTGINDLNEVYVTNGDWYINDGFGNVIRLTQGGQLAIESLTAFTTYNPISLDGYYTIKVTDPYTVLNLTTFATPAFTVTLPIAASVPPDRFYYFFDVGDNASVANITIAVAGGSSNTISGAGVHNATSYVLNSDLTSGLIYTDGVSNWYISLFNQYSYTDQVVNYIGSDLVLEASSNLSLSGSTATFTTSPIGITGSAITIDSTSSLHLPTSGNLQITGNAEFAASSSLEIAGTQSFLSGGSLIVNTGALAPVFNAPVYFNMPIGAQPSFANSFSFESCNIPMPAGTNIITLSNTQYNCPIINTTGGVTTLTGNITFVFPEQPGVWWIILSNGTTQVSFGGHDFVVTNATGNNTNFASAGSTPNIIMVVSIGSGSSAVLTAGLMGNA